MKPHALALGFFLVFAALAIGGTVGSPQPDPVCRACGTSFAQAAEDSGYDVSVANSTVVVRVHENGSATWTVTNRLDGADADSLAAPGATESVAHEAVNDGHGLPHVYEEGDLSLESVAVDDRTVTIRFTDPDAGTRRLGMLVVDYFHSDGVRGGWILDVDEFALVGPPNATVVNDPTAAIDSEYAPPATPTVEGGHATWHGNAESEHRSVFYEDLYVVYGESGTADWRVTAATALSTAPIWLGNLGTFVAPTAFFYLGALFIVVVGVDGLLSSRIDVHPRRIAARVIALGGLAVAAVPVVPNGRWLVGVAALYLVVGGGALVAPRLLRTVHGATALGLASLAAVAGAFVALKTLLGDPVVFEAGVEVAVYHLPIAVGLIVGHALAAYRAGDGLRPVLVGAAASLIGWFVVGGVYVPFASTPFGLVLIVMGFAAVAGAVAAGPLVALATRASEVEPTDAPVETAAEP